MYQIFLFLFFQNRTATHTLGKYYSCIKLKCLDLFPPQTSPAVFSAPHWNWNQAHQTSLSRVWFPAPRSRKSKSLEKSSGLVVIFIFVIWCLLHPRHRVALWSGFPQWTIWKYLADSELLGMINYIGRDSGNPLPLPKWASRTPDFSSLAILLRLCLPEGTKINVLASATISSLSSELPSGPRIKPVSQEPSRLLSLLFSH